MVLIYNYFLYLVLADIHFPEKYSKFSSRFDKVFKKTQDDILKLQNKFTDNFDKFKLVKEINPLYEKFNKSPNSMTQIKKDKLEEM